ncbi:ATP-binding cassette domain-containing protein (plasmid) [Rhizobium sp. CB3171]|uniref:ABC transporter ATP-binding protein n=1 Tax=Rhizobium sp. CB3171 TaxID=3039157 RepID=UPI0024B0C2F8|nr:ATP-binding cassette domain-containing protein [Rhizobium sp. CB3171]WFU04851.1 ATP-binding cassette domain-containing protein [Rhizobium sp. CB3171]
MLSLELADISITFPGLAAPVLTIERLQIPAGGRVAVTGASGSGKSTFVNVITGLERARQGRIDWSGTNIAKLSEGGRDRWRGANVGLVMQDFHLFPGLSAIENILLPARLARSASAEIVERAHDLLKRAGLKQPRQRIETMSRGEMQRVAVARALLQKPGVIVADEPTASLDVDSGEAVGSLLLELADQEKSTLIVVSHDERLTDKLQRKITFNLGRIANDTRSMEDAA